MYLKSVGIEIYPIIFKQKRLHFCSLFYLYMSKFNCYFFDKIILFVYFLSNLVNFLIIIDINVFNYYYKNRHYEIDWRHCL